MKTSNLREAQRRPAKIESASKQFHQSDSLSTQKINTQNKENFNALNIIEKRQKKQYFMSPKQRKFSDQQQNSLSKNSTQIALEQIDLPQTQNQSNNPMVHQPQTSSLTGQKLINRQYCYQCDLKKYEVQRQFIAKQVIIDQKHYQQKQTLKIQFTHQYNQLWMIKNQINVKNSLLEQEVSNLRNQLQRSNKMLEDQRINLKNMNKQSQVKIASQREQLTKIHSYRLQHVEKRHQHQLSSLKQNLKSKELQVMTIQRQKQMLQQEAKSNILNTQVQNWNETQDLRLNYRYLNKMAQQRQESRLLVLTEQFHIRQAAYLGQISSLQELILNKEENYKNVSQFISALAQKEPQNNQFYFFGQQKNNLVVLNQIRCQFQNKLTKMTKQLKEISQAELSFLSEKIKILQIQNSELRQKLNRRKKVPIQKSIQNQQIIFNQQSQKDKYIFLEQQIAISKKQVKNLSKQLILKQEQLSTYQQIILNLEINLQSHQLKTVSIIQLHQKQLQLHKSKYSQILMQLEDNRTYFEDLLFKSTEQIIILKAKIIQFQQIQQNKCLSQCTNTNCLIKSTLLLNLKQKYKILQQKYENLHLNQLQQQQKYQIQKSRLTIQIQQQHQRKSEQILAQIGKVNNQKQIKFKQFYQQLTKSKTEQIEYLSQIVSQLTITNFSLTNKLNQSKRDLSKIQKQFQEITKHFYQHNTHSQYTQNLDQ